MIIDKPFTAIYVAKPEYIKEISDELGDVSAIIDNLVFSTVKKPDICFAQDVWCDPHVVEFNSISDAVKILRQAGVYWYLHPVTHVRRSRLIEEQLRKLPSLERHFPIEKELPEIGCFSLLDKNTLVYSKKRWKKWPMGRCQFIEDKKNPPNRAYLKLWEALTLLQRYPEAGDTALDLGASPGGWTYVLQSLGANVTAIDKASLDQHIAQLPRITFLKQSAFALDPQQYKDQPTWVLSDIACYPERLYELATKWLETANIKQMIFTIKLQGETNLSMIKKFNEIPNSRTLNLDYNKHEATFFYPAPKHMFVDFE